MSTVLSVRLGCQLITSDQIEYLIDCLPKRNASWLEWDRGRAFCAMAMAIESKMGIQPGMTRDECAEFMHRFLMVGVPHDFSSNAANWALGNFLVRLDTAMGKGGM